MNTNCLLLETKDERKKFKSVDEMEKYLKKIYKNATNILVLNQINKKIKYPSYSIFEKCFEKNPEKKFEKVCKIIERVNEVI